MPLRIIALPRLLASLALLGTTPTSWASLDLAQAKHCTACHAVQDKRIGPPFKAIAAKYAGDKQAAARLAKKIQQGGVGVWGQIPMSANPHVNDTEAQTLASWVLSIK
jgi:cytochrome c